MVGKFIGLASTAGGELRMIRGILQLKQRVLDEIYPRICCSCGKEITEGDEHGLCWDCRADSVALGPPWCERCGQIVAGRIDHVFTCSDCEAHPPQYHQGRSLFHYEGGVREAIHALKYHRNFSVIPDLSRMLLAGVKTYFPDADGQALVAVPLHRSRQRKRGFNQDVELIRGMLKLDPRLKTWQGLKRIRNTDTQTKLSKAARKENVRSAFAVKKRSSVPERVLLIDDVMTTGATLDACAVAMKKAGVKEVNTLTIARG
ncbi:ComF family protein [Kiritimatiellaeota bacterium B1221]|nr:ComF family protein [Kiritimatiellaeota bacterium B1221]